MRKKRTDEEHSNSERWLLTYADMITLLMAFFIMMYSMSVLNLAKFREAAISIRSGFGGMVKGQGKSPLGTSGQFASKPSPIQGDTAGVSWKVIKPLVEYVETGDTDEAGNKKIKIGEDNRGIVITMSSDSMLFGSGSAKIRRDAEPTLNKIAAMIAKTDNLVRVEGHTCSLPTQNAEFASNWELSTARATEVLRYLVESKGLPAQRFSAAGYGSVRPVAKNDSNQNRGKNRRVEIVLIRPDVSAETVSKVEPRVISDPNVAVMRRSLD